MNTTNEQLKYTYLVGYSLPRAGGIGRAFVSRATPISSQADVDAVEKLLAGDRGSPLVLLSFCLLGDGAR